MLSKLQASDRSSHLARGWFYVQEFECLTLNAFLLLMCHVPNVAKRDQCNIEDWPTDDRPLFLEEPSWKNFKRPYLHNIYTITSPCCSQQNSQWRETSQMSTVWRGI